MALIDRVKNILLTPKTEWPVIAAEPATVQGLFTGYAAILALLPLAGIVIAGGLLSIGAYSGLTMALSVGVIGYVIGLAMIYVTALIVNAVLPGVIGKPTDMVTVLKLLIYSATPGWVAGLVAPFLGFAAIAVSLLAFVYTVYLVYLGVGPVLGVSEDKQGSTTAIVVVIQFAVGLIVGGIVTGILVGIIVASLAGGAAVGAAAYGM